MQFNNPIVGQEELIRSAIKSQDYEPGVSGWRIASDGSAEFTDLTVISNDGQGNSIELENGEITITDDTGNLLAAVQFNSNGSAAGFWTRDFAFPRNNYSELVGGTLEFGTVDGDENTPATISFSTQGIPMNSASVFHFGPRVNAGSDRAIIELTSNSDNSSEMNLSADTVSINGVVDLENEAFGITNIVPVSGSPTSATVMGFNLSGSSFFGWATANTSQPGDNAGQVVNTTIQSITATSAVVWIHRKSTNTTGVYWLVKGI